MVKITTKEKVYISTLPLVFVFIVFGIFTNKDDSGLFFELFIQPYMALFEWLGSLVGGNYGLAIVLLAVLFRLITVPFHLKAIKNEESRIRRLEPHLQKIKNLEIQMNTKDVTTRRLVKRELVDYYNNNNIGRKSDFLTVLSAIHVLLIAGLHYVILYSPDIIRDYEFLWFTLDSKDYLILAIAVIISLITEYLSIKIRFDPTKENKKLAIALPSMFYIVIAIWSFSALSLYFAANGLCALIIATVGKTYYRNK